MTVSAMTRMSDPLVVESETDEALFEAVLSHYEQRLSVSEVAGPALAGMGITDAVTQRFRVGYADRTLGLRLPERKRVGGRALRSQLVGLGLYRRSGHEHFVGCLTVPVLSGSGAVLGLFGRRLQRGSGPEEFWATGLPGGIFHAEATSCDELVVVASPIEALAVVSVGHEAVVAPGRPGGFSRGDRRALQRAGVRHLIVLGAEWEHLCEQLDEDFEVATVPTGAPLSELLGGSGDPPAALRALLASADPQSSHGEMHRPGPLPPDRPALPDQRAPTVSGDAAELHVTFGARRWRVRGADRQRGPDTLRVALAVTDEEDGSFHLDTLDLCQAKARSGFVEAASAELSAEHQVLRLELTEVLFATEAALANSDAARDVPAMTETARQDALELLGDPRLMQRVSEDLAVLGVVGEETNLLVAYLSTISRKAERPFGVVIQSSTAAGKSTLADAVCQLVPEEDLASYSALTGQALYYVGATDLAHKVLAVAEEQGAARATYALKLLVTEGRLSIASTGKDPATGKLRTRAYEVAGPVALVLTTTATEIDPELANRLVVLGVDEERAQTRAIQAAQRRAATLEGLVARMRRQAIVERHRNAQRLLEPLPVVIGGAEDLVFPDAATRHRRDHQKLLSLICASALLHQHQRTQGSIEVDGRSVRYIEADASDVALGLGLGATVLGRGGDELAPQTRRLLAACEHHVMTRAESEDRDPAAVTFTRRELRELLGWSEHQVRSGLGALVALEYLLAVPGGPGRQHCYLLADALVPRDEAEPREPRGTPRGGRDPESRGGTASCAGATGDPAPEADADRPNGHESVHVGADAGRGDR